MLLHEMKQNQEHVFILSTADPGKLQKSIREWGWTVPVLADEAGVSVVECFGTDGAVG